MARPCPVALFLQQQQGALVFFSAFFLPAVSQEDAVFEFDSLFEN